MFSDLSWLGILACVYAFARLLHYAYLRLEDSNSRPFLQKVLLVICFILWILSAPVTIVMGVINFLHFRRLEDKVMKDCSIDPSSHNYHKEASIPLEIIAVILFVVAVGGIVQNNNLRDQLEELESSYSEGYDEGYSDGYLDGKDDSYDDGYDDGFYWGHDEGYGAGYDDGYNDGYSAAS